MKQQEKPFITRFRLKERGWTDGMIKKFLGEPDDTLVNPVFRCAAPMVLYDINRVKRIEKRKTFKEVLEKSKSRKISAQKSVKTKMKQALDYVDQVKIEIPIMEIDLLFRKACDSYNDFHEWLFYERGHDFEYASPKHSNREFLTRISANYLRHECTSYEDDLLKLYGKTGVQVAHDRLQKRINDAIKEAYPQLDFCFKKYR